MSTLTIGKLLVILAVLVTSGCSSFVKDGQPVPSEADVILQTGQNVGQTFVARDDGLNGIEIFLVPDVQGSGSLTLHVRDDPQSTRDAATALLSIQQVHAPAFYRFAFSPQVNLYKRAYYFVLELEAAGKVRIGASPGDTYLDGAMYQNGNPVDAQLAFRLTYDPLGLARGLVRQVAVWLGVLAIAIFLYVLPGLALLALLWRDANLFSWGEKLGLAAGISIALYPLLLLWANLVNLHLGSLYAWLPGLAALAVLIWRNHGWRPEKLSISLRDWNRSGALRPDLALLVVIVLIILVRFWAIRSLQVPMWGDSYQHTMIAQLIADNGGLFDSWTPYADIRTFTYHFGFHVATAAFHWVSGVAMPQAVLWTGQILNILAVLALYPLAVRVSGNRWAGVGAVLIAGLLTPMPMFYLNWGRYTQLAGQVILPGAVCAVWAVLESKHRDWHLVILTWIVISGLALTHYRVLIFALPFFVAFFLLHLSKEDARVLISRIFLIGLGAGLLFLPWFIHTFAGKITLIFATQLTTPAAATPVLVQEYNAIGDIFSYLPAFVWLLLPLCIVWGLWRRERDVAIVSIWWGLLLLAANPQWLRLPGEGALSNFAVFIGAYIPASVLVGSALVWFMNELQVEKNKFQTAALVLLIVAVGLWGFRQRLGDLRISQHALVTSPDIRAATWIRENTPANARFLVNSFFAYGDSVIVGSDGGWWLPLLARRSTMLPPINYASEGGPRPDYREWINALPVEIKKSGITCPDVIAPLRERGITHVYIGQRQGRVNYAGPDVLQPERLLASSCFRPTFHQDRVWVFEVAR